MSNHSLLFYNKYIKNSPKFLRKLYIHRYINIDLMNILLIESCELCDINTLNYLIINYPDIVESFANEHIQNIFDNFIIKSYSEINSRLLVVEWFLNNFSFINIFSQNYENIFQLCLANDYDLINWMINYNKTLTNSIPFDVFEKIFNKSLEHDDLKIVKLIYEKHSKINLNCINRKIIVDTNNKITNWLCEISKTNKYDIFYNLITSENQSKLIEIIIIDNLTLHQINKCDYIEYSILYDYLFENIELSDQSIGLSELSKSNRLDRFNEICMINPTTIITDCTHKFCYYCIKDWKNKKEILECPYCRKINIKLFEINSI